MDFREPLQALVPGATGRVLGVLTQTSMSLSGRAIAKLADVSATQAARVLPRLVELGVVESRSAPPAILYSLAPNHVSVRPLLALSDPVSTFVDRLAELVSTIEPRPKCVGIFGSLARRDAGPESDIDLLVVRPSAIPEDDDAWMESVDSIRVGAADLSGNRIDILEVAQADVTRRLRSEKALWREIARDFVVVSGMPLDRL